MKNKIEIDFSDKLYFMNCYACETEGTEEKKLLK
tara:strand:- start:73 stop:174 length:102 start_codon:yes stop_codon:yes gene_type:complete